MKKLEPHPRTDHIVTSMTTEYKGWIGPIGVCVCVCCLTKREVWIVKSFKTSKLFRQVTYNLLIFLEGMGMGWGGARALFKPRLMQWASSGHRERAINQTL